MRKVLKRNVAIVMLLTMLFSIFSNIVYATEISSAYLTNCGDCGRHLQYWKDEIGDWSYVITTFVAYNENGVQYPAYCLDKDASGVGEQGDYTVNINRVIDDDRIWRVIINGYPYQSPSAMGVANEDDAFVATKQAVYCILYGWDAEGRYAGGDERGDAIKNAIVNLVNIGRYGSQTRANTDININQNGEFFEDGDYYSQRYSVNSPLETAEYTITATANLPEGSVITDLNNNAKSTFVGNEQFKIKVPRSQLGQDVNGTVVIKAKCKTYPVFYGETTIAGTQDYAVTFDPYGDIAGQTNLNVKTNTGKIQINKLDDETSQPISGVTFGLYLGETEIGRATTDENGIATFENLYQNNYIVKELETNEKYIINDTPFDIRVEYNKTAEQDIENEHKKGNIKVYKIDKDNNRVVLGNVEFDLFSHEFDKVIGTYNTDVNGELEIKDLRIGDYSLIEKKTNRWYNLADDTDILVEWNLTKEQKIENELKKGAIKIIKVDKENNEVKLENVKFKVMDKDGNVLEELITDKNGEAQSSNYPIRDFSELKIQETETLDNYVLDDEIHTITLEENQIKNITFENEKIKGQIEITKVSSNDNKITGDKKGTTLEGAKFEIYNSSNELVETVITDKEGKVISGLLVKGEYKIKEVDSGSIYYLINTDIFNAEIKEHKEIVKVNIEDNSVDVDIEVEKKGFVETQSRDSIYYDFSNIHNKSNVALDNFTWSDSLPTNALRANRIYTGTWNEDLKYSVWYKTNLSDDYIMLQDNLRTTTNNEVKFTDVALQEGEFITDFEFRFGIVKADFREIEQPRLYCDMLDNLPNGFVFVNHTKVSGNYEDVYVEDTADWKTVTYFMEINTMQKLPRTGM